MRIKAGDSVVVTAGKDKGKTGTVLRVLPSKNRIVVSDCNMRTKHVKATPQRAGQIVKYEASMDASNVMCIDPKTKKPTRIGYGTNSKGHKVRIARKSGEEIVKVAVKDTKAKTITEKKGSDGSKGAKGKESSESKDSSEKTPFWKKMGFGAGEDQTEEGSDGKATSSKDHSVPDAQNSSASRSHQRGS